MSLSSAVRSLRSQLSQHIDLVPLFGAYVSAGILAGGIMLYTSVKKSDVTYNRWWNPDPTVHINPTKYQQKFAVLSKEAKALYTPDSEVERLRREIYSDRDWLKRKSGH